MSKFVNITDPTLVVESLLFMFTNDGSYNMDNMFATVSDIDLNIFQSIHTDPLNYALVDDLELSTDATNIVTVDQFRIISLIKRYMGKFFPIIINGITLAESFIPTDNGVATGEIYSNSMR